MIITIISILLGSFFVLATCWICYLIFWITVNLTRMILYHCFDSDWFTEEEKIRFGLIEKNMSEVEVVDPTDGHEIFWKKMNAKLDVDLEVRKSSWDDDIYFQAIIKNKKE
jgi:hypothetical protein